MKQSSLVDRRTFVKGMLAAGATVTVAACAPVAAPSGPVPAAPVAPPAITGPAWIHPKSLVRAAPGYGGAHLTWKYGDAIKWLAPEKYPADAAADALARLPKEKLTDMYSKLNLSRQWETQIKDLWLGGKEGLYGYFHMSLGEEALSVGVCGALNKDDYITSTHRGHADLIAKGGRVNDMSAEIWYKATGYSRGYGGSMHIVDASLGILGSNGIVGVGVYLASGAAWSAKVRKSGQVAVTLMGDSAYNSRSAGSSIRSAVNYKLPVFFVAMNNFQGVSNPIAVTAPAPYVADYFSGLGLPTVVGDGNSVADSYFKAKEAADRARAGDGPTVLELLTYRWMDHQGFAGGTVAQDGAFGLPYRTDDEVRAWLAREPIARMGAFLVERGLFTQAELDALKQKAVDQVKASIEFARAGPEPRAEDGVRNAYINYIPRATQFFEHPAVT